MSEEKKREKWKRSVTVQLPNAIADELNRIREEAGLRERQKWALATVAVLLLRGLSDEQRRHLVSQALGADSGNAAFVNLIAQASSGELGHAASLAAAKAGRGAVTREDRLSPSRQDHQAEAEPKGRQKKT